MTTPWRFERGMTVRFEWTFGSTHELQLFGFADVSGCWTGADSNHGTAWKGPTT